MGNGDPVPDFCLVGAMIKSAAFICCVCGYGGPVFGTLSFISRSNI